MRAINVWSGASAGSASANPGVSKMLLTAVVARRAAAAEAAVENLVGAGRALVVDTMRRAVVRDTKRRARRVFCMF